MNRFKALVLIAFFAVISLVFGSDISRFFVGVSNGSLNWYYSAKNSIIDSINEHFNQEKEINRLREENAELKKSAVLLSTFAHELDQILLDKNSSKFEPNVKLVRALSYINIKDYNKFWIKFDDFNTSQIYGLIKDGYTAGIVTNNNNRPQAIMQHDTKSVFSVYVGDEKIPGFANGDGRNLIVKFIPQWLSPKVGDEVYTSGLDDIFFAGISVGKVEKILDEDLYKSAVVKPYASVKLPAFLYVITKDK